MAVNCSVPLLNSLLWGCYDACLRFSVGMLPSLVKRLIMECKLDQNKRKPKSKIIWLSSTLNCFIIKTLLTKVTTNMCWFVISLITSYQRRWVQRSGRIVQWASECILRPLHGSQTVMDWSILPSLAGTLNVHQWPITELHLFEQSCPQTSLRSDQLLHISEFHKTFCGIISDMECIFII